VQEALGASSSRPASEVGDGGKLGAGIHRTSTAPISFERYERMAVEHALAECSSGRSFARRRSCLGFAFPGCRARSRPWWCVLVNEGSSAHHRVASRKDGGVRLDGPPSLAAYERLALERALAETGGDKFAAARLLRVV
jgi:hypothetical protein